MSCLDGNSWSNCSPAMIKKVLKKGGVSDEDLSKYGFAFWHRKLGKTPRSQFSITKQGNTKKGKMCYSYTHDQLAALCVLLKLYDEVPEVTDNIDKQFELATKRIRNSGTFEKIMKEFMNEDDPSQISPVKKALFINFKNNYKKDDLCDYIKERVKKRRIIKGVGGDIPYGEID